MAKGKITPFLVWNHASDTTDSQTNDNRPGTSSSSTARHSSSSIFPSLQRLDTSVPAKAARPLSVPPSALLSSRSGPIPILSLKLSAPSFLDVVVRDRENKNPLYLVETVHDSTSVYRLNGITDKATKVATVQWPTTVTKTRARSGRTVQMANERWRDTEEFLKFGPLGHFAYASSPIYSPIHDELRHLPV